ncbi:MAG: (2Fe-2S)-binding protein [Pseudomonadota bacterium]
MYICICNAVTEKEIEKAVDNGCNSLRQLEDQLGVASQCGSCACEAASHLQKTMEKQLDRDLLLTI